MDNFSLLSLPNELWGEICHHLLIRDRFRFAICSKTAWRAIEISGALKPLLKGEDEQNKLPLFQYVAVEIMNRTLKPHIVLNKTSGRAGTHIMWFHILNDVTKCNLIICNLSKFRLLYETIPKLKKVQMYNSNPELSSILFCTNIQHKNHKQYLNQHFDKGTFHSGVRVVVYPFELFKSLIEINNRFTRLVIHRIGFKGLEMLFGTNPKIKSNLDSSIILSDSKLSPTEISKNVVEVIDFESIFKIKDTVLNCNNIT